MIQPLPPLTPDAERAQRTIARCHERLGRLRPVRRNGTSTYLAFERAFVGGLCLIYISGVALIAIQMLGVDR